MNFPITVTKKRKANYLIQMNVERLERFADSCGFFQPAFLKSLKRSEQDVAEGRLTEIKSLKNIIAT